MIMPTVKQSGSSVMVGGCFASARPGQFIIIDGTINSALHQIILKENVSSAVHDLKLKRSWVKQKDNDPKHTSKSTSDLLKRNKMNVSERLESRGYAVERP